jgi:hypothetical protein
MSLQGMLVGLEPFCRYLVATGRKARIVDGAPDLHTGFFFPDRNVIALEDSPIDLVSLHLGGSIGLSENLASPSFAVGVRGIPLVGRKVSPIQYHWVVRLQKTAYPWLATKLVQETRGFVRRERVGMRWTGKLVGPRFEADPGIMEALASWIRIHDVLEVRPEPDRRLVRIVHKRSASFSYNLFDAEVFKVDRDHAGARLIDAFERMAVILRAT